MSCPYINLVYTLTTSPTLQSPLACNQWQHLLHCSTIGQYTHKKDWRLLDFTPVVTSVSLKICLSTPIKSKPGNTQKMNIFNQRNAGVCIITQTHWMPCISPELAGTHCNLLGNNEHRSAHIPSHYVKQHTISSLLMQLLLTVTNTAHPCEYLAATLSSRTESWYLRSRTRSG